MSVANSIGYGVLSRINVPLEQPFELEVMLMSTVSAMPQGDESFEQGGQRGAKKHASSLPESRLFQIPPFERKKSPFPTARGSLSLFFRPPPHWGGIGSKNIKKVSARAQ